jgi:hypothetical protein
MKVYRCKRAACNSVQGKLNLSALSILHELKFHSILLVNSDVATKCSVCGFREPGPSPGLSRNGHGEQRYKCSSLSCSWIERTEHPKPENLMEFWGIPSRIPHAPESAKWLRVAVGLLPPGAPLRFRVLEP